MRKEATIVPFPLKYTVYVMMVCLQEAPSEKIFPRNQILAAESFPFELKFKQNYRIYNMKKLHSIEFKISQSVVKHHC